VAVQEQVSKLEITVDDIVVVHVLASADELNKEEARLGLRVAFAPAEQVHERAIVAQFQDHVNILVILETVDKAHNVRVVEHLVQLDLCPELGVSAMAAA
jgi:hypothetical protein